MIIFLLEKDILNILSKYNNQRENILFILKEIQNNDEDKEIKQEYCILNIFITFFSSKYFVLLNFDE